MRVDVTLDNVAGIGDTDRLWKALLAAKAADDHRLVRAIENRMRELSGERRFAHLSDEELEERIAALSGQRAPDIPLRHSPPGGEGPGDGAGDVSMLNRKSIENQKVGLERTRADLLDELRKRRAQD